MTSNGTMSAPEQKPAIDPSDFNDNSSSHDVEGGQPSPNPGFGEAPDGGLEAWLVAAGAGFLAFGALGYINSFGAVFEYWLSHQLREESADKVAWIGSMTNFLQFAAGSIAGPLFDRFGAKVIRPAAVALVFGVMMTSLGYEYWHFMLAHGVLVGAAMGFVQFPAITAVAQYFTKKRGAAMGFVISGSSIGGIVLPIAISKMLNDSNLGFGWTIRIIGFIMLPLFIFSIVTVKERLPPRKTNFYIVAAFKQGDFLVLVLSLFCTFIGMFTPFFYLPSYAVSIGMNATLASYLLAILNGASTFGRIIPGILADKFGRLNVLIFGGLTSGIIVCCMDQARDTAALVVFSIFFGFTSGTLISGGFAALSLTAKDPRDIGTYLGMGVGLAGLAALVGPPINGALLNRYGGFFEVSIFSGVMLIVGSVLAFATKHFTPQGILGMV